MPSTKYSGVAIPKGGLVQDVVNGGMASQAWYGDSEQGERVVEVSGDVARSWVITLLPRAPSIGYMGGFATEEKPPDAQRTYARISWGMMGGQAALVAEVDIGHGVTIPVHGSTVLVDVFVPTQAHQPQKFVTGAKVRTPTIIATCAPANGAVYAREPLTRELYIGNLAPAEIKLVGPIPRFAKSYVVLFGGEYSGAMTVDVTEANPGGSPTYLYDRWYMNSAGLNVTNQPRWQPRILPSDGGALRITSMEPTATLTQVRAVFFLSL
jgi:hypothetical protein